MPNLNPELQQKFIEKSTELFLTYLSIDKLDKIENLEDLKALGGELDQAAGICTFPGPKKEVPVKDLADYTLEDYKDLLAGTTWKIGRTNEGKYRFSTELVGVDNESYTIGGADKMSLNALHISNLGQMIRHFSGEEAGENMLVTMTTGSGKTFTQAILLMAEYLSGVEGVFVLPNKNLLEQFENNIQDLIPKKMYDGLSKSGIVLETADAAFTTQYKEMEESDSSKKIFSFDEAHTLSEKESSFLKMQNLADKFVNLYLTATPTSTLERMGKGLSGKRKLKNVASMSNAEKVKQGYALKTEARDARTKTRGEMDKISRKVKFFDKDRIKRFIASLVDPIPASNLAYAFAQSYLYNINMKEDFKPHRVMSLRDRVRWGVHPSATQGKTLILANNFEDIVNIDLLMKELTDPNKKDQQGPQFMSSEFYFNKNLHTVKDVYDTLVMSSADGTPDDRTFKTYQDKLNANYKKALKDQLKAMASNSDTEAEINTLVEGIIASTQFAPITNSMHGIIDLALSIVAAGGIDQPLGTVMNHFDRRYLEQHRLEDLNGFTTSLREKAESLGDLDTQALTQFLSYSPTNKAGLSQAQAEAVAPVIKGIIGRLQIEEDPKKLLNLVDNWYASNEAFKSLSEYTVQPLEACAKKLYKWYDFRTVDENEGLELDQVFSSLTAQAGPPKTRIQRPVEQMNPYHQDIYFKARVESTLSSELATNAFRLGICSVLVTDKKVEGFSDPNLHSVALFAHSEANMLANPANVAQGFGRSRGLDKTKCPDMHFVSHALTKHAFGVEQLNKEDYNADYIKGLEHYKKQVLKSIGTKLGEDILAWIRENSDIEHQISDEQLADKMTEMAWDTLKDVNKLNGFQFHISAKEFEKVLSIAVDHIAKKESTLKKGTQINLFVRVIAFVFVTITNIQFKRKLKTIKTELDDALQKIKASNASADQITAFTLYRKIIVELPLADMMKHFKNAELIYGGMLNESQHLLNKNQVARLKEKLEKEGKPAQDSDIEKILKDQFLSSLTPLMKEDAFKKASNYLLKSFTEKEMELLLGQSADEVKLFRSFLTELQTLPSGPLPEEFKQKYFSDLKLSGMPKMIESFNLIKKELDESLAYCHGFNLSARKSSNGPNFLASVQSDYQPAGHTAIDSTWLYIDNLKDALPLVTKMGYFKSHREMATAKTVSETFLKDKHIFINKKNPHLKKVASELRKQVATGVKDSKDATKHKEHIEKTLKGEREGLVEELRKKKPPTK